MSFSSIFFPTERIQYWQEASQFINNVVFVTVYSQSTNRLEQAFYGHIDSQIIVNSKNKIGFILKKWDEFAFVSFHLDDQWLSNYNFSIRVISHEEVGVIRKLWAVKSGNTTDIVVSKLQAHFQYLRKINDAVLPIIFKKEENINETTILYQGVSFLHDLIIQNYKNRFVVFFILDILEKNKKFELINELFSNKSVFIVVLGFLKNSDHYLKDLYDFCFKYTVFPFNFLEAKEVMYLIENIDKKSSAFSRQSFFCALFKLNNLNYCFLAYLKLVEAKFEISELIECSIRFLRVLSIKIQDDEMNEDVSDIFKNIFTSLVSATKGNTEIFKLLFLNRVAATIDTAPKMQSNELLLEYYAYGFYKLWEDPNWPENSERLFKNYIITMPPLAFINWQSFVPKEKYDKANQIFSELATLVS